MKLRMGKKLLACLCSVALMAGIGTSLLPAAADTAEIPEPGYGQQDLLTPSTGFENLPWTPLSYTNGVVDSGEGASDGIFHFTTTGLDAQDTYVYSLKIHQTKMLEAEHGVYVIFRFTDINNYFAVDFRSSGTLLIGKIGGVETHIGSYLDYKLPNGEAEIDLTIVSSPETVTAYVNGQVAFDNAAVPTASDGSVLGAGIGFIKMYSMFTADSLTLYKTEDADITVSLDVPPLPSADANLIKADSAFGDPWNGTGAFTYQNGVIQTVNMLTEPYTFKDLGLTKDDSYVFSLDLEYTTQDDTVFWYRPEIVIRSDGTHRLSVGLMSVGAALFVDGEQYGSEYKGFLRGNTGKAHLDIISEPKKVTVFINGIKALEAEDATSYEQAWVGVLATNTEMTVSNMQLYKMPSYTITAQAGENGSISPDGEQAVEFRSDVTYTITPNEGYLVDEVLVDGVKVNPTFTDRVAAYTFEGVRASHTISATFRSEALPLEITAVAGEHGTITPDGTTEIMAGESQTYTITPDEGYEVADVKVDGKSVGKVTTYTFENVVANHTIEATFQLIPSEYTITATPGQHGTIDPSGEVTVERETDKTFTITPDEGFKVADVLVDGKSVSAVTEYTFENVVANHTIAVSFSREPGVAVLPEGAVNLITPNTETEGGTYENGVAGVTVPADALEGSLIFTGLDGLTAGDTFVFSTQLYLDAIGKEGWNGPRLYFRRADDNNYLTVIFTPAQVSVYGAIKGEGFGDWGDWRSDKFGCKVGEPIDVIIVSAPDTVSVYVNGQLLIDEAPMPETDEPMAPYIGLLASGGGTSFTATGTAVYKLTEDLDVENTITATAGEGGSISPEGASQVFVNAGLTYTITPNGGYEIEDVLVDGKSVGAVNTYTFTNVVEDHTIEATFQKAEQTVPDGTPIKFLDLKGEDAGNYFKEENSFRIPMQLWQHQYYLMTDPEYLPESFYFKARISFQMIDEEENYHGIRILFKSKDYENNFQVVWFLDGTFYPVALVDNEYVDYDSLGFPKVAPINTDDSYLMEISCVGNHFTFWMDGEQVLDFTVPEEFQGYRTEIGFQQSFVAFSVDDIEMYYGPRPADANPEIPPKGDDDEDPQEPGSEPDIPTETGVAFPMAALVLGGTALAAAGVTFRMRKNRRRGMSFRQ